MKALSKPSITLAAAAATVCAVMLAFTHNASAITNLGFNDQYVVGTISPGAPASPSDAADYINYMITLGLNTPPTAHDFGGSEGVQIISRSGNTFPSLPNAVFLNNGNDTGTTTTIDLGAGGTYTYLFAKYDGQNDNSQVWYIGNLSGIITIPLDGPLGHGLSGWVLFGPGVPGVPDGGTTAMLLGAALGALGMARRFLMS